MSQEASERGTGRTILPWIVVTVVVLSVAMAGGFFVAYLVATGRAVDGPAAVASPTPRPTPVPTDEPLTTDPPSTTPGEQPRRTPTPSAIVTPSPPPIEHVVARGESLTYIAGLYCTSIDAILEINDIANPNRIQRGQVILIPGEGCEPAASD